MLAVLLTTEALDVGGFTAWGSRGSVTLPSQESSAGLGVHVALPFGREQHVRPALFTGLTVERMAMTVGEAEVTLTAPTFHLDVGLRARWGPGPLRGVAEAGVGVDGMLAIEEDSIRSGAVAAATHGLVGAELTAGNLPPLLLALRVGVAYSPDTNGWQDATVNQGNASIYWQWAPYDAQAALCAGFSFGAAR